MITNSDRARVAQTALQAFEKAAGEGGEDATTQVRDLLADLWHLCDRLNVDIAHEFVHAKGMYEQELAEDDAGDWAVELDL